ncbi:ABC transporter permease [Haladaptatus sp. R4]|uniref:carbohydrate ABC transporter permease n=1 Tax=Haladaptatus sp. R4 TaxID=1679489 RepID=UPI0007B4A8DB|nr:sugar ABC transporter permease [Haladaptatus sp. R4]KZN23424.1 ABC transporter permease [Haladaptatus sp. R4]
MATDESTTSNRRWRFGPGIAVLNRIERLSETQFVYLMLVPLLLLLGTMAIWPLIYTANISLHADSITTSNPVGKFVGLKNYADLLTGQSDVILQRPFFDLSQPFKSAIPVTILFTVGAIVVETVLGFAMALVLDQQFRGRRWVRVGLIVPWAVPIVIQGMIFYLMFQPSIGFAVEPLQHLGIISSSPLATSHDSLLITIIADIWKQSAFMALLILAGLQSIDRSLYQVAKISGASKWQQFRTITFPLVLPTLLVALLFRTIAAVKVYGTIETISSCNTVPSMSCLVVSMWNASRYGSAAAIAFIIAAAIGMLLIVYLIQFNKQESMGL